MASPPVPAGSALRCGPLLLQYLEARALDRQLDLRPGDVRVRGDDERATRRSSRAALCGAPTTALCASLCWARPKEAGREGPVCHGCRAIKAELSHLNAKRSVVSGKCS